MALVVDTPMLGKTGHQVVLHNSPEIRDQKFGNGPQGCEGGKQLNGSDSSNVSESNVSATPLVPSKMCRLRLR